MSAMRRAIYPNRNFKILMLGLDNAGKTTVLYQLLNGGSPPTLPANEETVQLTRRVSFTIHDVGFQQPITRASLDNLFQDNHCQDLDGLIFVIDSSDQSRFEVAKRILRRILSSHDMTGVPVVVFANKQDLPQAVSPLEVTNSLSLSQVRHVQGTSATDGSGLTEGMRQLRRLVREFRQ